MINQNVVFYLTDDLENKTITITFKDETKSPAMNYTTAEMLAHSLAVRFMLIPDNFIHNDLGTMTNDEVKVLERFQESS